MRPEDEDDRPDEGTAPPDGHAKPRLFKAAKVLREILPGDPDYGDALSTTGETPTHLIGRTLGSLETERPSLSRQLGLGALQVWQALSEAQGRGRGDEDLSILFTDLVGFSSWALTAGDGATVELLRAVAGELEGAIHEHAGRVVKRLGDGVMAVFLAPEDAVRAALDANAGLQNVEIAGYRPRMRAGVHSGRPRKLGGDYLGVDVNVAARVMEAAKPGEVLVSEPTCEALLETDIGTGRARRLKAEGTPKGLRVIPVKG